MSCNKISNTRQLHNFTRPAHSCHYATKQTKPCMQFLDATLRKATMSFVMIVRLAVCPNVTTRLPLDEFSWKLIFVYFQQCVEKMKVSWKS